MNLDSIKQAKIDMDKIIRPIYVIESNIETNCHLYLKPENLQYTGSFKLRGAYNKMLSLTEQEKAKGVIACSAGNHAQGVALSAKMMNVRAIICMPASAPKVKIESTKKLGAEVVLVDGTYDDAYEKALELQEEYGYTFVHPFNDEKVIEGQATIGLEILEDLPETDVIICAVGGGGLISGIAYAAKQIKPSIKVYGVESAGAPSMYASVANGYITKLHTVKTFADGIAVKEVGNKTFEYTEKYVDDVLTVSDVDILETIKTLLMKDKLLAEGAGAAPVTAVLKNIVPGITPDSNVVCVVSGGNIDVDALADIIENGL